MAVFGKRWTDSELEILEKYDDIEVLKIKLPGRTEGAIRSKLSSINRDPKVNEPWTKADFDQFPKDKNVNKRILLELSKKLSRDRNHVWAKMKSLGYTWVKTEVTTEVTEDNPYPMHGQKWTEEELALFPKEKEVNKEILDEVIAKIPLRKPSSIWPKMKKEGYIWIVEEEVQEEVTLSKDEKYILSLAHELGFRKAGVGQTSLEPQLTNVENQRAEIAKKFYLPEDFNSTQLSYAITTRMSPLPWEMDMIPELLTAYAKRDSDSILEAARVLHAKLGRFIDG